MSPENRTPTKLQRANLMVRRARYVLYVVVIAMLGYYKWRFDLVRLPHGSSPLLDIEPGTRLIVDVKGSTVSEGDAVFYRLPDGHWLLGRVQAPPPSAPNSVWQEIEAGALWIRKERSECPGDDSLRLGPIPAADIMGRVCGSVPW